MKCDLQKILELLTYLQVYKIILIIVIFTLGKQLCILLQRLILAKEAKIVAELKFDDNAFETLDKMIQETLEEYRVFTLNTKELHYIKSSDEQEIVKYIQESVSRKMSTALLKKLSQSINEDYVGEYIGRRIYLAVLNFVLEYNIDREPTE